MRKFYLAILVAMIGHCLNAQITLNSATHLPQIGDTFTYVVDPNLPTVDFRKGGANQTWDFTGFSGTPKDLVYGDLAISSDPSNHPLTDVVEIDPNGNGAENYYVDTTGGRSFVGQYIPGVSRIVYTDIREFMKFPITYNDVFNETFAGVAENLQANSTTSRGGTIEITADGYGDLILPYTTIYNVLRVKLVYDYADTLGGVPVFAFHDTIYTWYNSSNGNFIASVTLGYLETTLASRLTTYIDQSNYAVGLDDPNYLRQSISFYPNPARNLIYLENQTGSALQLDILDVKGRQLKSAIILEEKLNLELAELPPGIYFLRYSSGAQLYMEKLVIE